RIVGVQSSTAAGISEIDKVSQVIQDVSDIVSSIAAAIEQQAAVTKDIARNINEASAGVGEANTRVAQTSEASREGSREIAVVDQVAGEMADGSEHVRVSAAELEDAASRLQSAVSRFYSGSVNGAMLQGGITAHQAWGSRLKAAINTGKLDVPISAVAAD